MLLLGISHHFLECVLRRASRIGNAEIKCEIQGGLLESPSRIATSMVNALSTFLGITLRVLRIWIASLPFLIFVFQLHARDAIYTVLNFIAPFRPRGKVIPLGRPGYGGMWPQYGAPSEKDVRSPCPGLNALANHGILPRNGKKCTYKMLSDAIQHAYNLSPTLAEQLTSSAVVLDHGRGYIDLNDLNALNVVQHDASFTRPDIAFCPDQGSPHADLVEYFLSHASDGKRLSLDDMVYFSGLRRSECKASNGQYSLTWSFLHEFFGSGNSALMYSLFDGNVRDLRIWLSEEKFPDGWEPKSRWAFGHTIAFAQKTSIGIEFNINEHQKSRETDAFVNVKRRK